MFFTFFVVSHSFFVGSFGFRKVFWSTSFHLFRLLWCESCFEAHPTRFVAIATHHCGGLGLRSALLFVCRQVYDACPVTETMRRDFNWKGMNEWKGSHETTLLNRIKEKKANEASFERRAMHIFHWCTPNAIIIFHTRIHKQCVTEINICRDMKISKNLIQPNAPSHTYTHSHKHNCVRLDIFDLKNFRAFPFITSLAGIRFVSFFECFVLVLTWKQQKRGEFTTDRVSFFISFSDFFFFRPK